MNVEEASRVGESEGGGQELAVARLLPVLCWWPIEIKNRAAPTEANGHKKYKRNSF